MLLVREPWQKRAEQFVFALNFWRNLSRTTRDLLFQDKRWKGDLQI